MVGRCCAGCEAFRDEGGGIKGMVCGAHGAVDLIKGVVGGVPVEQHGLLAHFKGRRENQEEWRKKSLLRETWMLL